MPIPNEHTDRYIKKAAERDVFIQTGTFLEVDPRWPGVVFNTTCLIGPDGILSRYRKVNPWLPWEVHASPHDLAGYDEPLFPVVETEIGRLGAAICYDWLFPEAIRALALAGAEVLIRVSAYMDPWGATPPLDWWTLFNRRGPSRTSPSSWPQIKGPAPRIIHRFRGLAAAWSSTSTAAFWPRPIQGRAKRSSSARSIWPRCGPSGTAAAAIISFPISGPKPILNSTLGPSFAPADAQPERASPRADVRYPFRPSFRPAACPRIHPDSIIILEEQHDGIANCFAPVGFNSLAIAGRPGRFGMSVTRA